MRGPGRLGPKRPGLFMSVPTWNIEYLLYIQDLERLKEQYHDKMNEDVVRLTRSELYPILMLSNEFNMSPEKLEVYFNKFIKVLKRYGLYKKYANKYAIIRAFKNYVSLSLYRKASCRY